MLYRSTHIIDTSKHWNIAHSSTGADSACTKYFVHGIILPYLVYKSSTSSCISFVYDTILLHVCSMFACSKVVFYVLSSGEMLVNTAVWRTSVSCNPIYQVFRMARYTPVNHLRATQMKDSPIPKTTEMRVVAVFSYYGTGILLCLVEPGFLFRT